MRQHPQPPRPLSSSQAPTPPSSSQAPEQLPGPTLQAAPKAPQQLPGSAGGSARLRGQEGRAGQAWLQGALGVDTVHRAGPVHRPSTGVGAFHKAPGAGLAKLGPPASRDPRGPPRPGCGLPWVRIPPRSSQRPRCSCSRLPAATHVLPHPTWAGLAPPPRRAGPPAITARAAQGLSPRTPTPLSACRHVPRGSPLPRPALCATRDPGAQEMLWATDGPRGHPFSPARFCWTVTARSTV